MESAAPRKLKLTQILGGLALAFLMYNIGYILAGLISAFVFTITKLSTYPIIIIAQSISCSVIGIWVARRSNDIVLKDYSGRGIFILFLCLNLIALVAAVFSPDTSLQASSAASSLATPAAAYWWFWRRDTIIETTGSPLVDIGPEKTKGLHRIWEPLAPIIMALPILLYFIAGLAQIGAVSAQIESFLGLPSFISTLGALFLTYIPVVGNIIGYFGAKDVWGWEWWQAALLCFLPIVLYFGIIALSSAANGVAAFLRK